ncbi:hypothetical protein BGI41_00435 [Methanobrevibacter sp. 87.7]|uniref:hypothetical protein n=1 Tax=Methanobrevibacter sp. 87.7 TaxID=387957 RepID=UPI000B50884B|nr:hypothetical protein [Methanobrevibacter sp. 87.7]OWT33817.1 hypothetical protein BGI41_00435 [Methanobrevibacter sp. 87.7]
MKAKTLICMYNFLPYSDTGGNDVAKEIYNKKEKVDIIHNKIPSKKDEEFYKLIKKYINNDILLDTSTNWKWKNVKLFIKKSFKALNELSTEGKYETIYTKSMFPINHLFGFIYKIRNPDVKWIAKFSDPILISMRAYERYGKIDKNDINKINNILKRNNKKTYESDNYYFYTEYLTYLFADKIIFTNESQKELMLSYLPIDEIKDEINKKSIIKNHITPDEELYTIKKSEYNKIDKSKINFGYFGIFYEKRNIYNIFSSLNALNKELKDKVLIHLFIPNPNEFQKIVNCMPIKNNITLNNYLPYLEFLNTLKKFDCLIVNDANTKNVFKRNPYLPSKISDYLGSGTDIWKICEKNSPLSSINTKYTSNLENIFSIEETLKKIINK